MAVSCIDKAIGETTAFFVSWYLIIINRMTGRLKSFKEGNVALYKFAETLTPQYSFEFLVTRGWRWGVNQQNIWRGVFRRGNGWIRIQDTSPYQWDSSLVFACLLGVTEYSNRGSRREENSSWWWALVVIFAELTSASLFRLSHIVPPWTDSRSRIFFWNLQIQRNVMCFSSAVNGMVCDVAVLEVQRIRWCTGIGWTEDTFVWVISLHHIG